jgi:hypothetical protein
LKKSMYSHLDRVALLPLQWLVPSILQCLIIHATVFTQVVFQWTQQINMWYCKVRIAGGLRQHCPSTFCDNLSNTHTCVCSLESWRSNTFDIFLGEQTWDSWALRLLHVSIQLSEFTVVPLSKKFTRITFFSLLCELNHSSFKTVNCFRFVPILNVSKSPSCDAKHVIWWGWTGDRRGKKKVYHWDANDRNQRQYGALDLYRHWTTTSPNVGSHLKVTRC